MQNLIFILELVIPVFLIVMLGYYLRKLGLINDNFVKLSSKIVFTVSLPALIFVEVSDLDVSKVKVIDQLFFVYIGTIISFFLVWFIANFITKEPKDKASFIQGSFRGNFAIVGLAIITNVYGIEHLGNASLILAFTIPLYNVLAVIALTVPLRGEKQLNILQTILEIFKNPLIIAVIIALPFSYLNITIPKFVNTTVNYLAELALPLALLGIGGFMNFKDVKDASGLAIISSVLKLVVIPLLAIIGLYYFGFRNEDMGILFILFACPTAIASFIMAEAMGANSKLAGNILLITTLASIITISLGLFILKENGLI